MQNKGIKYIFLLLILSACIKPFDPNISENAINKYVVQGMVGSIEGWQTVLVSRTSSLDLAEFLPINGCELTIIDDLGNTFELDQYEDGAYRVWMNGADLVPGKSYMLEIVMPNGDVLESSFDRMPDGPQELGDVYFEIKDVQTDDPEIIHHGIQFYTDFAFDEDDGNYYHWKCTETWEYHTEYPLEFYYDGEGVHQVSPPDYSKMICYRTDVIESIFTLSTINLSSPFYNSFPLNYVRNNSDQLEILYSLLVEQIALSENAYNYWDKLRINLDQSGGLYTSQPLAIKGNLINKSNSENEVLGFFQASTVATKRIFVEPVEGLELDYLSACTINSLRFGLIEISPHEYPAYLFSSGGSWAPATMTVNCVDCTHVGGVTQKPDYWPN